MALALETVARVDPHVIVTDIILPGEVDGYQLARRLRASEPGRRAQRAAWRALERVEALKC
jgi:CheY-like chemotaxis protein